MFYMYRQNNSGGTFDVDAEKGIGHRVFIEAENKQAAEAKALSIGIYFNGVDDEIDCDCCGDRWDESPDALTVIGRGDLPKGYFGDQYFIHYADGSIEHVNTSKDDNETV